MEALGERGLDDCERAQLVGFTVAVLGRRLFLLEPLDGRRCGEVGYRLRVG